MKNKLRRRKPASSKACAASAKCELVEHMKLLRRVPPLILRGVAACRPGGQFFFCIS